ncbi:hypothetical protein VN12_20445 [Pirellula sp. SH-Sr6A]|nr:hypothetical protein VN12_20445 [Pirellula sp. SH-Sr6A]
MGIAKVGKRERGGGGLDRRALFMFGTAKQAKSVFPSEAEAAAHIT